MISRKNITAFTIIAIFAVVSGACTKADNKNSTTSSQSNTATTNSSANTSTPTQNASTAGSPTDAYKAAYNARKNKDIEGLKKLLSKDIIEFLTMMGEADQKDKKTLDAMLKELCERPQAPSPDARNEKINGDKATIEYIDESGTWQTMDFVKEDGAWKLTIDKPDAPPTDNPSANKPAGEKKP